MQTASGRAVGGLNIARASLKPSAFPRVRLARRPAGGRRPIRAPAEARPPDGRCCPPAPARRGRPAAPPRHGRPGEKQRHGLRHHRTVGLARNRHRLHPPHALGLDVKRDAARYQNSEIGGPPGQVIARTTGRFQHVLAVVEHQQRPAARHRLGDSVKPGRRGGSPDPHALNQGGNHLLVGAARNQVDIARHHARPADASIHAASTARAVFPTPPTPVSVTTVWRLSLAAISPSSAVLPTKEDRLGGSRTAGSRPAPPRPRLAGNLPHQPNPTALPGDTQGRGNCTRRRPPEWPVCYFMASRSSRQACSQRRQASAQTRQCSCIRACRSHSSPQLLQMATQASSSGRVTSAS